MVNVIVDSSVLIEKIRFGSDLFDNLKDKQKTGKVSLLIPVVVIAELWAGESMNFKRELDIVEQMISIMRRIDIGEGMAKLSGEIVRKYKVGVMDALIAAAALEDGAMVATINKKDFKKIKGLKLYNS